MYALDMFVYVRTMFVYVPGTGHGAVQHTAVYREYRI